MRGWQASRPVQRLEWLGFGRGVQGTSCAPGSVSLSSPSLVGIHKENHFSSTKGSSVLFSKMGEPGAAEGSHDVGTVA